MRVFISTRTVGQAFATVGVLKRHNPGRPDHGAWIAETDERPYGFTTPAMNSAIHLAERLGHIVVDEDYQP